MLKLKRRPESPNWQIEGVCPYTREFVRESTRTADRQQADAILTLRLNERREIALFGNSNGTKAFAAAVIEYVKKTGNKRYVAPLLEHFGRTPMREIEDTSVTTFCDQVYPNAKASTLVRQVYGPLQAIWNLAVEVKMAQPRKFKKPTVKRSKATPPDDQWLMKVLQAMKETGHDRSRYQRAALLFMSFSGARASEVVAIRVKHYNQVKGTVLLEDTKTDVPRVCALPPFVAAVLDSLDLSDPEAVLFGYASRWSLNRIIMRACKRAGIPNFSPHKAGRHLFAARFLADGHSIKALMDAGGWASLRAVEIYAHMEKNRVDDAVRAVSTPLSIQADVLDGHCTIIPHDQSN